MKTNECVTVPVNYGVFQLDNGMAVVVWPNGRKTYFGTMDEALEWAEGEARIAVTLLG